MANDTYILILLLYHCQEDKIDIFVHTVVVGASKLVGPSSIYSDWDVCSSNIIPVIRKSILFIHAWSGCDSTSATSGHSKPKLMKAILKNKTI